MKCWQNFACLFFFALYTPCLLAQDDNILKQADRFLLDEVPYPVINQLKNNDPLHGKLLPVVNRLAEGYLINLDFKEAEILLQHGDSLTSTAVPFEKAYHHLNWSRYYYEISSYQASLDNALSCLKQLSTIPKNTGVELLRMKATLQLGKTHLQRKEMPEALRHLSAAQTFFKKDSTLFAIKLAQTYYSLGLWSKKQDALPEAIRYYEKAIHLFESSGSERYYDLGRCYNNLATTFNEQGNYGRAKIYYLQALDVKKKHGTDSLSLAITCNNIGRFYAEFGNRYKAKEFYQQSIALLRAGDPRDQERLPEFLNNYASFLLENDELELAEKTFRRSLAILKERPETRSETLILDLSLSGLMIIKNNLRESEDFLAAASSILADSLATKHELAIYFRQRANLYAIEGKNKEAEICYLKAKAASRIQDANDYEIHLAYGLFLQREKRYRSALTMFQVSLAVLEKQVSEKSPQLCQVLNFMGECYHNLARKDSAIHCLQRSMKLNVPEQQGPSGARQEAVFPTELIASYLFLSWTYRDIFRLTHDSSNLTKSRSFVTAGLHAIDAQRKSLAVTNDQLSFDNTVAYFFEHSLEAFLGNRQRELDPEEAFYVAELSRAQSLGKALRQSNLNAFANVSTTLMSEEETLRNRIRAIDVQTLKEVSYAEEANPDLLQEYQRDLSLVRDRYQKLQDSIRRDLPGYYQLKYDKTLVTLKDIRQDILNENPQTALIEFTTGDSAVYVQLITHDQQEFYKIENAATIKNKVLAFRNQIKLGFTTELYETGAWLYDQLLKRAVASLERKKIKNLIIIPDQVLCYLPFEALVTDRAHPTYVVSKYMISYAYSATLLWQKYKERSPAEHKQRFMGLAPEFAASSTPVGDQNRDVTAVAADRFQFLPLVGNKTEVDRIRSSMEKNNVASSVLEGQDATEASFRKLDLRQFDYVHFATHGFVDMDNPQLSGVAFTAQPHTRPIDNILFTNEVYEMQFHARLVSLSSCDSGIGKLYKGEGMIGLSQAFLYAGARNLAVTLWKVDDLATRDLMIDFYEHIPGNSLSVALTMAKRKMLKSGKFSHPAYWSSFVLIGL